MDAETLKLIADVLTHGGSAAALALALIVWNAVKYVRSAVTTLERIAAAQERSALTLAENTLAVHESTARQETKLERIHEDIRSLPLALVAARHKGV